MGIVTRKSELRGRSSHPVSPHVARETRRVLYIKRENRDLDLAGRHKTTSAR
jgi:hypothetical protein